MTLTLRGSQRESSRIKHYLFTACLGSRSWHRFSYHFAKTFSFAIGKKHSVFRWSFKFSKVAFNSVVCQLFLTTDCNCYSEWSFLDSCESFWSITVINIHCIYPILITYINSLSLIQIGNVDKCNIRDNDHISLRGRNLLIHTRNRHLPDLC